MNVIGPKLSGNEKVLVISDIHIGDNSPTCWYQSSVHEAYLIAILDWASKQPLVSEIVLNGDIVDFWSYPFDYSPPSFSAIVAANPNVFGSNGAIPRLLDAKNGTVTYVEGNHDFGVTSADISSIMSLNGHKIKFAGSEYRLATQDNKAILFVHGHAFTMFNAPDRTTPWQIYPLPGIARGLPVGHFITRMISSKWSRDLPIDKTVADLAGQGAPNGLDLSAIINGIIKNAGDFSITQALLDSVAAQTGCGPTEPITLPFELGTTTLANVRGIYANLWSDWVKATPGEQGEIRAAKAAVADSNGKYLGWFAQMRAFEAVVDAVIMGHSHTPIKGLENSLTVYANSGFACPSVPDMGQQFISFVLIDATDLSTQVLRITSPDRQGYLIDACPAIKTTVVMSPSEDFSCYVIIDNSLGEALRFQSSEIGNGYFSVLPPDIIAPGSRAMIWLQDFPGICGSDASFTYATDRKTFMFKVGCPTGFSSNSATSTGGVSFKSKYGRQKKWGPKGVVEKWSPLHSLSDPMHPFFVWFTV
jgi:UDP-2,3-diacylglucosamine pyrophosphatase LpxH